MFYFILVLLHGFGAEEYGDGDSGGHSNDDGDGDGDGDLIQQLMSANTCFPISRLLTFEFGSTSPLSQKV